MKLTMTSQTMQRSDGMVFILERRYSGGPIEVRDTDFQRIHRDTFVTLKEAKQFCLDYKESDNVDVRHLAHINPYRVVELPKPRLHEAHEAPIGNYRYV
ncbi:hypothetical protein CMI37_27520 [Candidatus Pacearchaeota archaeon]|nr:hypothetical protein [Candidatus Pacearchaeota archaeon]